MDESRHVRVEGADGPKVYTLKRGQIEAKITEWGATIMSLKVPDSRGKVEDVLLGFESPASYMHGHFAYYGAIVGRVANRIAGASFSLNGKVYKLAANDGPNTLHGGLVGFDKVLWQSQELNNEKGPSVQFTYNSYDGEEGFPGDLEVIVTYTLTDDLELRTEMVAKPGRKATPVSLANHAYWNLGGHGSGDILGHLIQIRASAYTPVDAACIPTGEILSVRGTPFDFLQESPIGSRMAQVPGIGYDHNYALDANDEEDADGVRTAARVVDPSSGRVMELLTNAAGMQFYTSNADSVIVGKEGKEYKKHGAFCLETQGFPNAVNEPKFPTMIVEPGQVYKHIMIHRFSTT